MDGQLVSILLSIRRLLPLSITISDLKWGYLSFILVLINGGSQIGRRSSQVLSLLSFESGTPQGVVMTRLHSVWVDLGLETIGVTVSRSHWQPTSNSLTSQKGFNPNFCVISKGFWPKCCLWPWPLTQGHDICMWHTFLIWRTAMPRVIQIHHKQQSYGVEGIFKKKDETTSTKWSLISS